MKNHLAYSLLLLAPCFFVSSARAELREPPTFASSGHKLDLLIIARPKLIQLDEFSPTAWVYEVCYRRDADGNTCPQGAKTASEYGGMRLQLQPGDHLKIRFINKLPPAPPDAEHAQGEMGEMLAANPTNLHTHGLIVEPRRATPADRTYGDYVYVLSYPKGKLPNMQHPGLEYTDNPLDYDIYVPLGHPSGLFWIHPHVHGLALNQISYGLAGIITIGSVADNVRMVSQSSARNGREPDLNVRYLTLKDMQVLADNSVLSQEDPDFCEADPTTDAPREGYCPGQSFSDEGGEHSYIGGKWFFTINGQVFPTISVAGNGEVWRITHASGSRSYELALKDDGTGKELPFQILAIDGVTVDSSAGSDALARASGGKFLPVRCPSSMGNRGRAVCGTSLRMMPSSRIEIWVPPINTSSSATLMTRSYQTGPAGDDWPSAKLAHVVFTPNPGSNSNAVSVRGDSAGLMSNAGLLGSSVKIADSALPDEVSLQSATELAPQIPDNMGTTLKEHIHSLSASEGIPSPACVSLPQGHRRRIFFGVPTGVDDGFGLGLEELDRFNHVVPGSFREVTAFDHTIIDVCLPLGRGNKTVNELWELVNLAGEDHNFHIHQTKFRVLTTNSGNFPLALVDNIPVLHGAGNCDGSVASWRSGACQVKPVVVSIPFSEVGDFVYHCHILEHEDGGMMAHIRVVPYK